MKHCLHVRFDFKFFLWFFSLSPYYSAFHYGFASLLFLYMYWMTFLITHSIEITYCFLSVHIGTVVLYVIDAFKFLFCCLPIAYRIRKERVIKREKNSFNNDGNRFCVSSVSPEEEETNRMSNDFASIK